MDFASTTIIDLADAIRSRRVTAGDAVRSSLARINEMQADVNAFLEVFDDEAVADAEVIDARLDAGEAVGPLAGVPIAIKDNMCLDRGKTTCASRFLEAYRSPYSATAVQRLLDAGAVIVGKTNLDEFAMGSSGEHSAFGPTRNPHDLERVPGGSSSGSAAAVAGGMVPGALGSDTGGSIRQPASLCGIVGLKPTYGRVSRYGLVAFASSLDQIGPFARTVDDAALLLSVISGHDPLDSTSAELDAWHGDIEAPPSPLRIGIPEQAFSDSNHPGVTDAMRRATDIMKSRGAEIVDITLPTTDEAIAAYYIIAPAEASSNLARFDGIRYGRRAQIGPDETLEDLYRRSRAEGFGHEVQRRIMLGTHALSSGYYDAYYNTALKVRRLIKDDFDRAFTDGCHAVMMPTAPGPAFRFGEKTDDPLALYLEDVYTVSANLAGIPAISVPGITDETALPVGIQLLAPALAETHLLSIARALMADQ